ncbi:P-loop containing nucleoside triphosphate hydrolase protein [Annulohypoxylon maeteangense]|uniref:P-loop containing nucleoside triphosphate hydrolase protein n=1 Tax=Annulohypoxylon maeteangense TaxID=1927788 RepID=UPI002008A381|nr:P-loop containing nucleoside triphosphate hydrolase protein [Annulohypoxylon maeteangense]KAI0881129.1 P-loop containing nucleoside triphosphate hydrolase protein [Annulohypoxylon maeteangense]
MDYSGVLSGLLPSIGLNISDRVGNNATDNTPHAKMVESILGLVGLRGFAPIYGFVGDKLGIEPTYILTAIGVIWAFNKLFHQLYTSLYNIVISHFMCSIHILNSDDIYSHLMEWLASQPQIVNSRALIAETASKRAWEFEDASDLARDNTGRYLNFSNQEARAPPQYSPSIGLHGFWWKGQYFRLQRKRESVFDENSLGQVLKDQEDIVISCFWRSPEPIKQLLAHAKEQYYRDHQARTIVKRPSMYNRRYALRCSWHQVANRPVRDIKTVVLDEKQKLQVLADINEYLHPETPRWYANRGIPLRRGYLFYGPPGTGKTSLSFALAGIFGLDIHVISLLEPSLTEEDLSGLFGSLPRRCIVLLEDIDTAGLRRSPGKDDEATPSCTHRPAKKPSAEIKSDWNVSDLAKALKQEGDADRKTGISLSGLLNAIDGVASHEGRVLIMTTNTPEQLDEALIRPGRVDLQVAFANATQDQARELFIRMYEDVSPQYTSPTVTSALEFKEKNGTVTVAATTAVTTKLPINCDAREANGSNTNEPAELDVPVDELPAIAQKFGLKIPDSEFSPAQIQGYLLKRKKQPLKALEEVDMWVEGFLKQKALKSKIMQVQ